MLFCHILGKHTSIFIAIVNHGKLVLQVHLLEGRWQWEWVEFVLAPLLDHVRRDWDRQHPSGLDLPSSDPGALHERLCWEAPAGTWSGASLPDCTPVLADVQFRCEAVVPWLALIFVCPCPCPFWNLIFFWIKIPGLDRVVVIIYSPCTVLIVYRVTGQELLFLHDSMANIRLPSCDSSVAYPWVGFQNETGYNSQLMIDVQRILACLMIRDHQRDDAPQKTVLDLKYLSLASKAKYSNRLVLAMNANGDWRQIVKICLKTFSIELCLIFTGNLLTQNQGPWAMGQDCS